MQYAKAIANGISEGMVHAHHIVMKGNLTPDGKLVHADTIDAQNLLKKYGVDILDGLSSAAVATGKSGAAARTKAMAVAGHPLDNLCWAIRDGNYYEKTLKLGAGRGLHSHAYQKEVFKRINNVVKNAPSGATGDDIAKLLKEELDAMAKKLEDGKAFW